MNRGVLLDPLFIGSSKRPSMEIEANLRKAKGLIKKTSDEKEAIQKTQMSSSKGPLMKKRQLQKHKGANRNDLQ
jgi:hypothetical protein